MKKSYLLGISLLVIVFAYFALANFNSFKIGKTTYSESQIGLNYKRYDRPAAYINSGGFEIKNEIVRVINEAKPVINDKNIQAGIISHHLPTALPLIADFYKNLKSAKDKIKTFIIIGPDHNEKCLFKAATTDTDYETPFGILNIDKQDNKIFTDRNVKIDNKCFVGEHSIGVQAIFIKYFYPDSKIVPIIFSSAVSDTDLTGVLESIKKIDGIFVVGSMDFSHYQKLTMAEVYDNESQSWIEKGQPGKFNLTHIDSPPTIKLILDYAKYENFKPIILKKINSFAYTGQSENTTGYMSIFFR
jgi:MEMO1 family protein